jgi:hypothetical protein
MPFSTHLAHGGAHFAHQGQVFRQGLVGAFQHGHALLALEHLAQQVAREGPEAGQVDHAHLQLAVLAQPVGHGGGLDGHGAHAQDDVVGVIAQIGVDASVRAAGQLAKLGHALVKDGGDVLEEIGTLGGGGLHVGVLVGDAAGYHRGVHVPDGGHAPALGDRR